MAASCVLRIAGKSFDPDEYLRTSAFVPVNVYHAGDKRGSSVWPDSGLTVVVSSSETFEQQVGDAIEFLSANADELAQLTYGKVAVHRGLDFGVNETQKVFMQSYLFPSEIVRLAAAYEISLEVSVYGPTGV